jgi:hypothetical protein
MEKLFRHAVAALGAAALIGAGAQSSLAACGEINNNGGIDPGDAVILAGHIGGSGACNSIPADCDLDGSGAPTPVVGDVGVGDIVYLTNVLANVENLTAPCVGLGTVLPCPSTLSGTLGSNRQLAGSCPNHILDGTVKVPNNVTLTVQAGATVQARRNSSNGSPSVLIVLQGGKLNVPGNALSPVIFTSDATPGQKDLGDWGGVVLNGEAPINIPGGTGSSEGLPPGDAIFGGNQPNDFSGNIRFARMEFSGIEFSPDNELNVFTMNGVGRATVLENIQANAGHDDCLEWFGGTARGKFLVASGCRDDQVDWQVGWTGDIQHVLGIQNAGSAEGTGRHGIEADNFQLGPNNAPRSNPRICNMTLVGAKAQGSTVGGRAGALLRLGTAGKISNAIIAHFSESCFSLSNNDTAARACTGSGGTAGDLQTTEPFLVVQDSVCYNNGDAANAPLALSPDHAAGSATSPCNPDQWYASLEDGAGLIPATVTTLGPNPGFPVSPAPNAYPTSGTTSQYVPANAPPWTGAPDCRALNPAYFDSATYVGAFNPAGANWLSTPWISFATQ